MVVPQYVVRRWISPIKMDDLGIAPLLRKPRYASSIGTIYHLLTMAEACLKLGDFKTSGIMQ